MIRLILLILLLLFSLLTIFRAPEFHLWLAAIVVTEFAWIFVFFTLVILLSGFLSPAYRMAGTLTGLLALLLYCSPIYRARLVSSRLKHELGAAFGEEKIREADSLERAPFRLKKMFRNSAAAIVPYDTYTYVNYTDTALHLDFYPSSRTGNRPCVIVIHGGSWKSGDSRQLPELNNYLARSGYHAAAINYRMAPRYKSPDPVEDVKAALTYLKKNAGRLSIDTTNFIILGRSAGAQIGLLAAYTLHDPAIKGVIDFYGPADMVWGYSIPSNPLIMNSRKVMEDYLGGTYRQVPANFEASSPLHAAESFSIPTLIIHGSNDVLVSPIHSNRLDELLTRKHTPHYYLRLPWATHGFDFNINGPGGQLSTYAVRKFLVAFTR